MAPPTNLMMTSEQVSELGGAGFELGGHTIKRARSLADLDLDSARAQRMLAGKRESKMWPARV